MVNPTIGAKSNVAKKEPFVKSEYIPLKKKLPYQITNQKKGRFIVIEGIDSSGTTTQSKLITSYLFDKSKENHIFLTREPTYSRYGLEARKLLEKGTNPNKNTEKFLMLFTLDRKEHYEDLIKPNLKNGIHVICDRYELSTFAYQSTQGISKDEIYEKHRYLEIGHPDITFLLDLDPEKAMERTNKRNEKKEVFEKDLNFQKRLRRNYLSAFDMYSNISLIEADKSIEYVTTEIIKELESRFGF